MARRDKANPKKSKRQAGFQFSFGIAVAFGAWGYSVLAPQPNVFFGWILYSIAFGLFAKGIWNYVEGRIRLKTIGIVVGTIVFVIIAGTSIRNATKPHFLLVYPGLTAADHKTRYYYMAAKTKPLHNLKVIILDDLDVARRLTFRLEELNPRKGGIAESFIFQPKNIGHERLTIIAQSRDIDTVQTLAVKSRGDALFPSFQTSVKDSNSGKVVFECVSKDYPLNATSGKDCGNDIFKIEP